MLSINYKDPRPIYEQVRPLDMKVMTLEEVPPGQVPTKTTPLYFLSWA